MPFDLEIAAVPRDAGPAWVLKDPRWLEAVGLPESLRPFLREINDGSYRDRILLITREELGVWHRASVGGAFDGIYSSQEWRKVLEPRIAELERVLSEGPRFFMVLWAEWESGGGD